ncbi:5'-3' exonuclease PLD3 [Octopus bimaculoides]|uniref:5'-3' exonuclease PLD3 n=1 Tax=Octopus bimaculoides TaxID=37653 RepID=UPI00071C8B85|nr:5'-3' exonuclease PLD3 [Octopus bimaculoides]XP_014781494.1 5'-3' exonuclease PLD3 [Octopus bimaculoides]XP_014781495.1 5'-3' exonuclease PLD3 [Octopus bimaculoides]|eukprot:XP_014781493.1 PREDICTED: phospholipase D3-like [Octopus bimaculoides]
MTLVIFFASVSVVILTFLLENRQAFVDDCWISLVETVPKDMTYAPGSPSHLSTYDGLLSLIEEAKDTIEIASLHWTLEAQDVHQSPSDWVDTSLFQHLLSAGKNRNVEIKLLENKPNSKMQSPDIGILIEEAHASVQQIDIKKLMGGGIMHTKIWIIDRRHFYIGSSNLNWRSLTQVKDLGVIISNCKSLAEDMGKIFDTYWHLTIVDKIPKPWPEMYNTTINKERPLNTNLNDSNSNVYLSISPPAFCANGRTGDIDAILDVINSAKKFIHIAVMDYAPALEFQRPSLFWPIIDRALRNVSITKGVEVFLLGSHWKHNKASMFNFLKSLANLNSATKAKMQVKMFEVPYFTKEQREIPSLCINHNKFMVTDTDAFIGTSSWSGDYFTPAAGLGLVVRSTKTQKNHFHQQLEAVFQRDWNSKYSRNLDDIDPTKV